MLEVEGLSIAFDTPVVSDISFTVNRGEVVGIVGESGCGKTMTALGVLDLLPPGGRVTGGRVLFDGVDISSASGRAPAYRGSRIGLISQEPMVALDPSFTIGSQLREPLRAHRGLGGAAARREALALLERVGINRPDAVYSSFPHEISGGMAQRVCIAIALAGQPDLLVADEPTTALDVTVQAEILDLLRSVQQEHGMGLIIVTHNLGVVADICDRTIVMYAGESVESCSTDDLFQSAAHPYTRGLLASSPDRAVAGEPIPSIPGLVPVPAEWPVGCHFSERCPLVTAACRTAPIPMVDLGEKRRSRCIRVNDLLTLEAS